MDKIAIAIAMSKADLNEDGKVPASQLPSYVDDVIEGYFLNGVFYEDEEHTTEITPEKGKIYLDVTSESGLTYRWTGSQYIAIGGGGGSSDYEDLDNKPSINGHELNGDMSTEDLELFSGDYDDLDNKPEIPSKLSDMEDDETHRVVTDTEKTTWNGKMTKIATPANGNIATMDANGQATNSGKKFGSEISAESTENEIPSSKQVYDIIGAFSLLLNTNNPLWGTVSGGGIYRKGTQVTAIATETDTGTFLCWMDANGHVVSNDPEYTFELENNVVLNAKFSDGRYIEIVSWASGTDTQLAAMLDAHYAGIIDIHDYWHNGDIRTITTTAIGKAVEGVDIVGETHAAQTVRFALMDSVLRGFTPADEDTDKPLAFGVGMVDGFSEAGYINPTNTTAGGWNGSKRRQWCNELFKDALPATFAALFRPFKWKMYAIDASSTDKLIESTELFALPNERMIFDKRTYSNQNEFGLFDQWDWYKTAEHRIKKRGHTGSAGWWWGSSPISGNSTIFCSVNDNGSASASFASDTCSLAPFGCI